jgi:hypothetical protein
MTAEQTEMLEGVTGRIVAVELTTGEQFFAEIVIVVNQPPTPDVFLLRVTREPDGAFTSPEGYQGESILLADIARIALLPGLDYTKPIA